MKIRSIFTAVAITLASVVSAFAQNNVNEMTKVIPPDAFAAVYGNGKKISSGRFMHGLLNMMKKHPELKDKCAEIEAELQKNSDGECVAGISATVNPKDPSDVKIMACGLLKTNNLAAQWDSNVQNLKKKNGFSVQQGVLNGMDYVTLRTNESAETTGYVLKLDRTTAYFTLLCPDKTKESIKPVPPVFYKKQTAFVQKLNTSSSLSVAIDADADADAVKKLIKKRLEKTGASIPPLGMEGIHVAVISISERDPMLRLTMQMYGDEEALVSAKERVQKMLDEAKKGKSLFAVLLNRARVSKKADQLSVSLEMPSQLLLGLVEMSLLLEQAEREAAETADDEEFVDPVLTEESQPAGKK